jgi:hypothetical protein
MVPQSGSAEQVALIKEQSFPLDEPADRLDLK